MMFTNFLKSFDGLNKTTSLSEIFVSSLVFGFRPILDFFDLIVKVPNFEIFNFFSFFKFLIIEEKNSSIKFSATCLKTYLHINNID